VLLKSSGTQLSLRACKTRTPSLQRTTGTRMRYSRSVRTLLAQGPSNQNTVPLFSSRRSGQLLPNSFASKLTVRNRAFPDRNVHHNIHTPFLFVTTSTTKLYPSVPRTKAQNVSTHSLLESMEFYAYALYTPSMGAA
jgi:hypothetical protein